MLSHEILEQPLVPDPTELSGTVVKTHARVRNREGRRVKTGPSALLDVCPQQGPPSDLQVLETWSPTGIRKVKNLSFIFTHVLEKENFSISSRRHMCVEGTFQ